MLKQLVGPAILVAAFCLPAMSNAQDLSVGDKAPAIDVEHWVSDRDGQFEHITEFEEGKVYVVEFWATWCGPCIQQMPHIAKLQDKYAESGLQIISISDEDMETVEEFLAREVPKNLLSEDDQQEMTFAELTTGYCLTTDPDQSAFEDYMEAAEQNGIPTAFIVGKTGEIELISHPSQIAEPIEMMINDTWDREVWAEKMKEREAEAEALRAMVMEVAQEVQPMIQEGDYEEAVDYIEDRIAEADNDDAKVFLEQMRVQALTLLGGPRYAAEFEKIVEQNKDDPMMLNQIAWGVVEQHQAGQEIDKTLLDAATKAAETAVEISPEDSAILDTLAHLLHMQGHLDRAIEVQTKSVDNDEGQFGEDLQDYLDELYAEKEEQEDKAQEGKEETDDDEDGGDDGR